jgi:hypothetical protein
VFEAIPEKRRKSGVHPTGGRDYRDQWRLIPGEVATRFVIKPGRISPRGQDSHYAPSPRPGSGGYKKLRPKVEFKGEEGRPRGALGVIKK